MYSGNIVAKLKLSYLRGNLKSPVKNKTFNHIHVNCTVESII